MSDNSRVFLKCLYGFDATVRRVAPTAWSDPSPCDGWTAADVLSHNLAMNEMVIAFTAGVGADRPAEIDGDPVAGWPGSFERLTVALDTEGALQTVAKTPWGEMAVDKFIGFAWVDPLIHTWDLAKATGQTPTMDGDLVARAYAQLERAGDSLRGSGQFGPAVEATEDMTTMDRFIAISGRDPRWTP